MPDSIQSILSKTERATERLPADQPIPNIDKDNLAEYIKILFQNDLRDRNDFKMNENFDYDERAYFNVEDDFLKSFPWPNASSFAHPLTTTLLDTLHSNLLASMFVSVNEMVKVKGIGKEDIRNARNLETVLNWQMANETEMYRVQDENIFLTALHGTGIIRVIQNSLPFQEGKSDFQIKVSAQPIKNVLFPIDAKSFKVEDADHVFFVFGFTENDLNFRKSLKIKGKSLYEGLEDIPTGFRIVLPETENLLQHTDQVAGASLESRMTRDLRYFVEGYVTYYPQGSSRPVELIVWFSPNGMKIHRVIVNESKIRPASKYIFYPISGYGVGQSLPSRIKPIQQKLNYMDKQITDAIDKNFNLAGFYEEGTNFDPDIAMRVPGGMYPIGRGTRIQWEQPLDMSPIVQQTRMLDYMWDLAERMTGLTELFQGRIPSRTATLGEAQLRNNRSEIRFGTIYDRAQTGWKETIDLIYRLDDEIMPREKKIRILGVADFQTIDELFPVSNSKNAVLGIGLSGQFDFQLSGKPVNELELANARTIEFVDKVILNPIFGQDLGNAWRLLNKQAEAYGLRDFETLVLKPFEANVLGPDEAIERIASGFLDIVPEPTINAVEWLTRITFFQKTDTFKHFSNEQKEAMRKLELRIKAIKLGQSLARFDARIEQAVGGIEQLAVQEGRGVIGQTVPTTMPQPSAAGGVIQ